MGHAEHDGMATTLTHHGSLGFIEVVFAGRATREDLADVTSRGIALVRETGTFDVLIDLTDLELAASLLDVYNLPARQYQDENLDRRVRLGLVTPRQPREREAAQFYEDACVNRGWQVRSFGSRDDALGWLKQPPPA
jgi:hypothetical protein